MEIEPLRNILESVSHRKIKAFSEHYKDAEQFIKEEEMKHGGGKWLDRPAYMKRNKIYVLNYVNEYFPYIRFTDIPKSPLMRIIDWIIIGGLIITGISWALGFTRGTSFLGGY